jgi:biotin-(acetyl-CoA carboxylase) ligase
VRVTLGADELVGRVAGLERDGRLLLDLVDGGMRAVSAGEVHLRPL